MHETVRNQLSFQQLWNTAFKSNILAHRTKDASERQVAFRIKKQCLVILIANKCPEVRIEPEYKSNDKQLLTVSYRSQRLHTKRQWLTGAISYAQKKSLQEV